MRRLVLIPLLLALVVAVVAAAAAAAGTVLGIAALRRPGPLPTVPTSVLDSTAGVVDATWTVAAHPVGDPVVGSGVVASYVSAGATGLQVRAWRVSDGAELWRRDAVPGYLDAGTPVDLAAVRVGTGASVTFLTPRSDRMHYAVTVVDLATGHPWFPAGPAVATTTRPVQCGSDVCFSGWSSDTMHLAEPARPLRVDRSDGRIRFDEGHSIPVADAEIAPGLYVDLSSERGRVMRTDRAHRWSRSLSGVFGPRAAPGDGSSWFAFSDVVIGASDRRGLLGRSTITAAIDRATGRVLWRLDRTSSCPGESLGSWRDAGRIVLCTREAGGSTRRIGVDLRSGAVRWERGLPQQSGEQPLAAGRYQPIRFREGDFVLDRVTGALDGVGTAAAFACARQRPTLQIPNPTADDGQHTWSAGSAAVPCSDAAFSPFGVRSAGVDGGGGRWIVSGTDTLGMYRVAPARRA